MANWRTHLSLILFTTMTLFAAVGCGGGGAAGPDGGSVLPGSGKLNWLDDGARKDAVFPAAALVRSTMMDLLQITGSTSGGAFAVSFGVAATPLVAPSTILCGGVGGTGQRPFASISYLPGAEPTYTSCSVTISTLVLTGTPKVTGTFEAVFPKTGGGTKTISDGTFDLTMTVNSI